MEKKEQLRLLSETEAALSEAWRNIHEMRRLTLASAPPVKEGGFTHGVDYTFDAPTIGALGVDYLNDLHQSAQSGFPVASEMTQPSLEDNPSQASLADRIHRLEFQMANTPRFTAGQLGALADGLEHWQQVSGADGREVVEELRKSVDEFIRKGDFRPF